MDDDKTESDDTPEKEESDEVVEQAPEAAPDTPQDDTSSNGESDDAHGDDMADQLKSQAAQLSTLQGVVDEIRKNLASIMDTRADESHGDDEIADDAKDDDVDYDPDSITIEKLFGEDE